MVASMKQITREGRENDAQNNIRLQYLEGCGHFLAFISVCVYIYAHIYVCIYKRVLLNGKENYG